jgi:hypothetical protein
MKHITVRTALSEIKTSHTAAILSFSIIPFNFSTESTTETNGKDIIEKGLIEFQAVRTSGVLYDSRSAFISDNWPRMASVFFEIHKNTANVPLSRASFVFR